MKREQNNTESQKPEKPQEMSTKNRKERPNDLVDTVKRGVAPKIKLAISTPYIYIYIHNVAQRDMQAIDFSSIGLSLVYFDWSVWRNKFKRGCVESVPWMCAISTPGAG